jgi:hypothetical protein
MLLSFSVYFDGSSFSVLRCVSILVDVKKMAVQTSTSFLYYMFAAMHFLA